MIGHLVAFRRGLIEESGGFLNGFESAHYDLVLRATERLAATRSYMCRVFCITGVPGVKRCIQGRFRAVFG